MGIAAYNRGSREISRQIYPNDRPAYQSPKPAIDDPLPEGRLRSGFLPENNLAGTGLYLEYENRWYIVRTRFQNLKRTRDLQKAILLFEHMELYGLCALERATSVRAEPRRFSASSSSMVGLCAPVSHREIVLAVVPTARPSFA